jgi:hypothetical protein
MRTCVFAFALVIVSFGLSSEARAGCWPSETFPVVCWLDTYGLACEAHHALTSAKAVLQTEPRLSIYEFETSHWWTSHPTVACPPPKTTKFTGIWDRETGKAEEKASTGWSTWSRYIYCSSNPWTGQGPPGVPLCSGPAGDPNVGLPVTSAMLSQGQKNNLLRVQEPVHTRCQQIEPPELSSAWLTGNSVVSVVAAHHEYQKIVWHVWFLDFYEFGPWHEVAAPKMPAPTPIVTKYTERRIATTKRYFFLNKPGRWKLVAEAKPTSLFAQLVSPPWSSPCPGGVFNVQ